MKKLLISLIVLSSIISNAQWYTEYGVTNMNELNEQQLNLALKQSQKTINIGVALTAIGVPLIIIGGVMYLSGLNEIIDQNIEGGLNKSATGSLIMCGGGLSASIGIPIWIVGANRKNIILVHLEKFKTSYIPSLGIRINF